MMDHVDDDLEAFAANGAAPLPSTGVAGTVENDGARIWYRSFGNGPPVFLLHGGMGHSGNWGHQVPPLVDAGYRAIVIDSRGHGRSTRDERSFSYELMAADARAVMDRLGIGQATFIGWSDGACVALMLAAETPMRASGVFYFACNMDPGGTLPFVPTQVIDRCFSRHVADYATLSATPDRFQDFADAVGLMQRTQPNYTAADLARIAMPVAIVQAEHDEFIRPEHAEYLARSIPGAQLVRLAGVSHFAPLQRPAVFNAAMLAFLARILRN